ARCAPHKSFWFPVSPATAGLGLGKEVRQGLCAPAELVCRKTLDGLKIDGLGPAGIRLDVERHLLAFRQRTHAGRFDGGGVDEHVLAAIVRRDETEALGGIKEFYCSDSHDSSLRWLCPDTCLGV